MIPSGLARNSRSVLLAALVAVVAGCGSSSTEPTNNNANAGGGGTTAAATPTFSPAAGTYDSAQSVAISTTTAGAVIHYTVDGSTPTGSSTTYTGPVSVASSLTLKAIATASGFTDSAVATAAYVINAGGGGGGTTPAATPTFSPAAGTYASAQSVTITSTTPGAAIRYTTDGSTPGALSTLYTAPVPVNASLTLQAIAIATGFTNSVVGSAAYVINTGGGGGGGGGGTSADAMCQAMNDAYARLVATCYHYNPDFLASMSDGALGCSETAKAIAAGRATYNASLGSACQGALNALSCADLNTGSFPSSCLQAVSGTVANGAVCYSDTECASGTCDSSGPVCPGTCHGYVGLGQACGSSSQCDPSLTCDSGTCKTPSAVGGACPCREGLWCNTSGGGAGTCQASLATGSACSTASGSAPCILGSVCVGSPSACQIQVGLNGNCAASAELCGFGYVCSATTHTCLSAPSVGQACGPSAPLCIGGYCDFFATSPSCVAQRTLGQSCTGMMPFECAPGLTCGSAGTCVRGYCPEP
jgi:hypothetical protein